MQLSGAPKLVLAGAITAAGAGVLWAAEGIPQGFGYDAVGPSLFPKIIGGGLIISGILTGLGALGHDDEGQATPIELRPVATILAAIVFLSMAIEILGWIPTAGAVFLAGTLAFGDRRIVLNMVIGLVLAGIILVAFNQGLGLNLPLGLLTGFWG